MLNILVINLARFGDIIQSVPMIQGLKRKYPGSRITMLVNNHFSHVCSMIPDIDDFVELDFKKITEWLFGSQPSIEKTYGYLRAFFDNLRKIRFDMTINITPHDIGIISSFLAGDRQSYREKLSDWSLYYLNITRYWKTLPFNVVDLFLKLAGLIPEKIIPRLQISSKAQSFAEEFLRQAGHNEKDLLIGFNTGASTVEKQWPPEHFIDLAGMIRKNFNVRVILFGSESERELGEHLTDKMHGSTINAIAKTSLMELAALMDRTRILITNDSGPMHIAAACSTRRISLHMGKEKCASTGPYGEGHIALQPKLECHPCKNPETCSNRYCREIISPDLVFSMVGLLLRGEKILDRERITRELKKAYVFKSVFDSRSFLDFFPVWKTEVTISELCTRFCRYMWDFSLSGNSSMSELERNTRNSADDLICIIEKYYLTKDLFELKKKWKKTDAVLSELMMLTQQCQSLSNELKKALHYAGNNIKTLQKLSGKIEMIDERIISLGEATYDLKPLIRMLCFEKENMYGNQISALVAQTSLIYRNFHDRCQFLRKIGKTFFDRCTLRHKNMTDKFKNRLSAEPIIKSTQLQPLERLNEKIA